METFIILYTSGFLLAWFLFEMIGLFQIVTRSPDTPIRLTIKLLCSSLSWIAIFLMVYKIFKER